MLNLKDLSVGKCVKLSDLDEIYDVVIILSDISDDVEDEKTGIIRYIGESNTKELLDICSLYKRRCVIMRSSEEKECGYDE